MPAKSEEQTAVIPPERQVSKGVASTAENAKLKHVEGGSTTRDDANDLGVPMLQGDPSEPTGPEDALGLGPKRGDYRDRIVGLPHETYLGEDGQVVMEAQRPRAEDIGDEAGLKGGVET